ncbi:MAG: hypothetical protein LBO03_08680 [Acidaminococcales bacterium]|jgi:hypothetical protein|nr:hypothetical protein [Acidaminococcales bacterium]
MKVYEFVPHKQVGVLRFGADRQSVRREAGQYKEFRKTKFSENTTDDFDSFFHAYYDKDDRLCGVEIFDGAQLLYEGTVISWEDYAAFAKQIQKIDPAAGLDGEVFRSEALGLRAYVPHDAVETVFLTAGKV